MAGNYIQIQKRPTDAERKTGHDKGTGGYGGDDQRNVILRQKVLPKAES